MGVRGGDGAAVRSADDGGGSMAAESGATDRHSAARRGYEDRFLGTGPEEYRNLVDAALLFFIVITVVSFVLKGDLSRGLIVGFLPLAFVTTLLGRRRLRTWLCRQRLAGHGMHQVL